MAGPYSICKKYVFRKLSTVRWKPSASNFSKAETFVTGSWDDEDNCVSLWQCGPSGEPTLLQELPHAGDVTDITYVSDDLLAVGSSNGSINTYQHNGNKLTPLHSYKHCHVLPSGSRAACTAVASNGSSIASVGEDARLVILSTRQDAPVRVIESGSDSSDYAVVFVRNSEVLTGNMQGQLRLWDTRGPDSGPVTTMVTSHQEWVRCLQCHPSQQHVVAAAGEAGTLTLWDMRDTRQPFTCIAAHTAPMLECRFHPDCPDQLFSCGLDGQLVHWDATCRHNTGSSVTGWLSPGVSGGGVTTTALLSAGPLPLNSADVQADVLLATADDEALYVIRNVILY